MIQFLSGVVPLTEMAGVFQKKLQESGWATLPKMNFYRRGSGLKLSETSFVTAFLVFGITVNSLLLHMMNVQNIGCLVTD